MTLFVDTKALHRDSHFRCLSMWCEGYHFIQARFDADVRPEDMLTSASGRPIVPNSENAKAYSVLSVTAPNGTVCFKTYQLLKLNDIQQVLDKHETRAQIIEALGACHAFLTTRDDSPLYDEAFREALGYLKVRKQ